MKLAVFNNQRLAIVEDELCFDVTAAISVLSDGWPPVFMSRLIANFREFEPRLRNARERAVPIPSVTLNLSSPVPYPGVIVAAPANYKKHVGELGARGVTKAGNSAREIGFFLKAPSSVVGAGSPILLPRGSARRFDHETELAVIIGQRAKNVPRARALDFVFGYSCLMDITMRLEPDMPAEERPTRKSFDTFTPMGPYLVTADEIPDPQALENQLWVNGELRQSANTRDMTVGVAELIELVSSVMTLNPGDIIATGTPEGVGPIKPGDSVRIAIQHVGDMTMRVQEAEEFAPRRF
jgi:2-keto-4-pentenoate hydratase/2-oxohepta-3-ene-1,7-dioic acid hydratase in catechol pathway